MIRIIIADDIDIIRSKIIQVLDQTEHIRVVGQASSSKAIIQVAKQVEFDIALLDIEMESPLAGIKAAESILNMKPQAKIIFLTFHEADEVIFSAFESGGVDYIIKDSDYSNIVTHIENVKLNQVEIDWKVQRKMQKEFLRLRRVETNLIFFIRTLSLLTPAEKTILSHLVDGLSIKDIAALRCVEVTTIKTQISHILRKLHARRTRDIVDQIKEMKLEDLLVEHITPEP